MDEEEPTVGEKIALKYADILPGWRGLGSDIDDAIRKAVKAKQEACATLAEDWANCMGLDSTRDVVRTVAAAIRAREES